LSNIYAFVIFGFVLNRIQNSLRFKAFQSNYLLNQEKRKTERHYQDALKLNAELSKSHQEIERNNSQLQKKNEEIVKQAQEIENANRQLQQLNLFKEEMTGMIVHDLKNPLNSIIGLAESEAVKQAGRQMLGMVMNMLDVQKYENTEIELDTAESFVDEIAVSAVRQVDMLLKQKSILLKNQIQNYRVSVEWELIERVFVNILTNAIKYTPNNGSILLVSSAYQNENGKQFRDFVKIEITDTGQGIPASKLDTVFQKFEQVVAKKSGMARSTGIGLTFCKLIVEAHGGDIGVESELGRGTTIWFTLPTLSKQTAGSLMRNVTTEKFSVELAEAEKELLSPFLNRFRRLSIYEYSSMEAILRDSVFEKSESLKQWKEAMNNALLTSNKEQFTALIDMISKPNIKKK
jgi:signal transduction histidine kinase